MDDNAAGNQPDASWKFKPGETITPGSVVANHDNPDASSNLTANPQSPSPQSGLATDTIFSRDVVSQDASLASWTAAEFIHHEKSFIWYAALAGAVLALAAIVYMLTKDRISTTVVLVVGLAFGIYGARKPRQRRYTLDEQGLSIDQHYLPYSGFRSFAIMEEGLTSSISFFPLKRFNPLITVYYDPNDERAIVNILSERLPIEDRKADIVDRFLQRIRF